MSQRLEQLKKLYDLDPADPFVSYGIAMEQIKLGQSDEALQWLNKTIELDADYLYAYFQKAKVLHQAGDTEQACAELKIGLERARQANDAKATSELGELLATLGRA